MRSFFFAPLAIICILLCLVSPLLHFFGKISMETYKWIFLFSSLGWFVFATLWASKRKRFYKNERGSKREKNRNVL